ncbi:MAG TPA: phosphatase PAP2 family protein [Mycobacteriales bacterium]|nr:phosphatase PAP2 family protein [Mycobacteriales bacterium]
MTLTEPSARIGTVVSPPVPRHLHSSLPHRLADTIVRRRFAITLTAVLLALSAITQQVLAMGPLVSVDYAIHNLRFDLRYPQYYDAMLYLVMVGQRGPTAIPVLVIAAVLARQLRSWRPLLLLGFALLALNGVVGVAKVFIARALPSDNTAAVFVNNGIIFPSGHSSNVVVTWGIASYLLTRYGPIKRYDVGIAVTAMASLVVGVTSIYLDTHWMTDIVAGWLIGAAILMVTIWLDQHFLAVSAKHRAPAVPLPRRVLPVRVAGKLPVHSGRQATRP